MLILDENFRRHLEAFESELFIFLLLLICGFHKNCV